jgi:2'-5' RNA ligase
MEKGDHNFAVLLEIEGEMLKKATHVQMLLSEKFDIKYILDSSPRSHITLESGFTINNFDRFKQNIMSLCEKISCFSLQAKGLGIFIAEKPVIYIRWSNNIELLSLKNQLQDLLKKSGTDSIVENYSIDLDWLPKTTLAYGDTNYENLSGIINLIRDLEFNESTKISSISTYSYVPGGSETRQFRIPLKLSCRKQADL